MLKKSFLPLAVSVLLISIFAVVGINFNSSSSSDENLDPNNSKGYVGLTFATSEVDPNSGTLWVTASPRLSGPAGFTLQNGSFADMNLLYSIDVFFGESTLIATKNTIVGGKSVPLRLLGNIENYPFDSYTA